MFMELGLYVYHNSNSSWNYVDPNLSIPIPEPPNVSMCVPFCGEFAWIDAILLWQRLSLWLFNIIIIQCEAPKIAKLVYNSNNYGLWYL